MTTLNIDSKELRTVLAAVKPAITRRTQLPILECVRIQSIDDFTAGITATNLELLIARTIPASGTFDAAIPYEALTNALKAASGTFTLISESSTRASYTSASGSGEFVTRDPADFPVTPTIKESITTTIERGPLGRILNRVAICAAKDDSRPVLAGIYLKSKRDDGLTTITAYAADGFVLCKDSMVSQCAKLPAMIPPARLAAAIKTAIPKDVELLALTTGDNGSLLTLSWPGGSVTTRLIEGTFPDADQIFPRSFAAHAEYDRRSLLMATLQCAVVAKDNNDIVRLITNDNTLTLSSTSVDRGSATVSIPIFARSGEPVPIAMNANYLAAALKTIDQSTVRISTNTPSTAIQISSDATDVQIIMPMIVSA